MKHDSVVHHPLGAAAYYYQAKEIYLRSQLRYVGISIPKDSTDTSTTNKPIVVHIGAQPDNSPHAVTLICFALALTFVQAVLDMQPLLDISVSLDFVDSASDTDAEGVPRGYQKGSGFSKAVKTYMDDYYDVMDTFSKLGDEIRCTPTFQRDLNAQSVIPSIVRAIVV